MFITKRTYSTTESLKDGIKEAWREVCDEAYGGGGLEIPKGFAPDAIFKASFVYGGYGYLSMPDGQCGAYACALSALIHEESLSWMKEHDFPYAEKTGSLTLKSGVRFTHPGELGRPVAHDNHAFVCF